MPNLKDVEISERIFGLFKGEPGTGKSDAAASFPEPYIFDFDRKSDSLKGRYPNKSVEFDTFNDFTQAMTKIDELVNYNPFETVIMDSLTFAADLCISQMIRMRGTEGKQKLKRGGIPVWEIEDFGGEDRGLTYLLDGLRSLKSHVILTAHVLSVESKEKVGSS